MYETFHIFETSYEAGPRNEVKFSKVFKVKILNIIEIFGYAKLKFEKGWNFRWILKFAGKIIGYAKLFEVKIQKVTKKSMTNKSIINI